MLGTAKTTGIVLDVARQRGGATPSIVTLHGHSRFGNDGAMTALTWVQLPSGLWVMSFNGTTSNINCGNDASLNPWSGDWTIESWLNVDALSGGVLFKGTDGGSGYIRIDCHSANLLRLLLYDGANVKTYYIMPIIYSEWAHGVLTHIASSKTLAGYKNGEAQAPTNHTLTLANINPLGNLVLGEMGAAPTNYEGLMALVRIYTYALTPAQIRAKFTATRRLFGV